MSDRTLTVRDVVSDGYVSRGQATAALSRLNIDPDTPFDEFRRRLIWGGATVKRPPIDHIIAAVIGRPLQGLTVWSSDDLLGWLTDQGYQWGAKTVDGKVRFYADRDIGTEGAHAVFEYADTLIAAIDKAVCSVAEHIGFQVA